jgi:8-oxo-dGTP diphosphatase
MNNFLLNIWRVIKGPLQWRVLWLAHHKFIIGISGVVLNDNNEVLLLKHKFWPEGSWGLPSGYAERGETLEAALAREVLEETGYVIEVEKSLQIVSGYKLRIEVSYLGKIIGGKEKIDAGEILEARFFSLDQTPESLLDSHKLLLEQVRTMLKKLQ